MQISEVLDRVDTLYPNAYTQEEKLGWCYDVSCGIRRNVMPLYAEIEHIISKDNEQIPLPEGVAFMDIESVFINGKRTSKVDSRSFTGDGLKNGDEIKLVYKSIPSKYTEVPAPYDSMYIDYVCAQIAFFQNALSDYQKFMMMYNEKLSEFAAEYRRTAPVVEGRGFKNLW